MSDSTCFLTWKMGKNESSLLSGMFWVVHKIRQVRGQEQGQALGEEVNDAQQVMLTLAVLLPAWAGRGGPAALELVRMAGSPGSYQSQGPPCQTWGGGGGARILILKPFLCL